MFRLRTGAWLLACAFASACGLEAGGSGAIDGVSDSGLQDGRATEGADAASDATDEPVADLDATADAATDASDAADAGADGSVADGASTADGGPLSDGSVSADASTTAIKFVREAHGAVKAASYALPIVPPAPGNFLAVLVSYSTNTSATVASIADNSPKGVNLYQNAGVRSVSPGHQAAEIWFSRALQPGATAVTVTLSATNDLAVWALEFSGLAASGGIDTGNQTSSQSGTNPVTTPAVVPSGLPALIVTAVGSNGTLGGIKPPNTFTGLAGQNGNGGAYWIATSLGPASAVFTNSNDGYNASIAAFR